MTDDPATRPRPDGGHRDLTPTPRRRPSPTTPIGAPATRCGHVRWRGHGRHRDSRPAAAIGVRWTVAAGLVVALVVGASAAGRRSLLTGSSPAPRPSSATCPTTASCTARSASTCPATSGQAVGEFLAKFPGFADQAALDTKLDEVLDRLVSEATDGEQTYTRGHQAVVRRRARVQRRARCRPASAFTEPEQAALVQRASSCSCPIKDEAAARPGSTDAAGQGRRERHATETYNGTELTVFTPVRATPPARIRDRRRQGRRRRRPRPRSRPRSTPRAPAASRTEAGVKAALGAADRRPRRLRVHRTPRRSTGRHASR